MRNRTLIPVVGLLLTGLSTAAPCSATTITFTGRLLTIDTDTGTGLYAGAAANDLFSGQFTYGDNAGQATGTFVQANEANYDFVGAPFSADFTNGSTPSQSTNVDVNIQDDVALTDDEATLVSTILGTAVTSGTLVDVWSVGALTPGAFEMDPDPTDQDDTAILFNGVGIEVALGTRNTTLLTGLGFQPIPPGLNDAEIAIFFIEEADASGNTLFSAIGILTDVTVVPEPATLWLLGAGLATIIRRPKRG